ncbi:multidrug and toxin extrusion protein 1-like isoform X2 [Tubulanus polymorphus]|uniref:multidrug and toxin extrusion protein 1-like isoform X2 n=1 Tax=Tubulanus polymorphus TaxID=672921 RepID=UPI003DA3E55A
MALWQRYLKVVNVFGIAIALGLGTALDTLISQTYGGNNKMRIGVYLQRGIMVMLLFLIPCYMLHLNITPLLVLIGQDRIVSIVAGDYILYFMPGLFFNYIYQAQCKFLYNQNVIFPPIMFGAIGAAVNAIANAILVIVLDLNTEGSAMSQSIGYMAMVAVTSVYMLRSKTFKESWNGFTVEALYDWGSFCSLAVPGMLMIFVEWGSFEIGTILTGLVGVIELDAQTIVFQIEGLAYMIPLGFSIAANIRTGQFLGSGNGLSAKRTSITCTTLVLFTALTMSVLLVTLRHYLPAVFTNESEVIETAAGILPILAGFTIFDSVAGVVAGVLRGCARQGIGAFIISFAYVVIALPIGITLLFITRTAEGIWWGLFVGIAFEALCFTILLFRTNWDEQVSKAMINAGLNDPDETPPPPPLVETHKHVEMSETDYTSFTDYTSADETTSLVPTNVPQRKKRRRRRRKMSFPSRYHGSQRSLIVEEEQIEEQIKPVEDKPNLRPLLFKRCLTMLLILLCLGLSIYTRFIFQIERCIPLTNNGTLPEPVKGFPYCNSSIPTISPSISPV